MCPLTCSWKVDGWVGLLFPVAHPVRAGLGAKNICIVNVQWDFWSIPSSFTLPLSACQPDSRIYLGGLQLWQSGLQLSEAEGRSYVVNKVCGHALVQIWLQPMDAALSEVIAAVQSPRQLSSYGNYFPDAVRSKKVEEVMAAVTESFLTGGFCHLQSCFRTQGGKTLMTYLSVNRQAFIESQKYLSIQRSILVVGSLACGGRRTEERALSFAGFRALLSCVLCISFLHHPVPQCPCRKRS